MKLLSVGCNSKLAKGTAVFNLPQGKTCPGKTPVCGKICYALKAERMYKAAAAMRARNYTASQQEDFVARISAELQQLVKKKGFTGYFRWHEAGDAYSQGYLDKIFTVAKAFTAVTFLTYTKSFHLNWLDKPANLKVYWSTDSSTHVPIPAGVTAHTQLKGEPAPAAETCKHTAVSHYCGSECHTCWRGEKSVYFPQH